MKKTIEVTALCLVAVFIVVSFTGCGKGWKNRGEKMPASLMKESTSEAEFSSEDSEDAVFSDESAEDTDSKPYGGLFDCSLTPEFVESLKRYKKGVQHYTAPDGSVYEGEFENGEMVP